MPSKTTTIDKVTVVEGYQQNKKSTVCIRPYFDPSIENMGLEKYGMALFDNVFHEEQLACLEINGISRYVTGLNEFAPEVVELPEDEREAKAKEIRKKVAQLEKLLAANIIDPNSKDFWNNVKLLRPDNDKLWSKIILRVGNQPVYLEPNKDPYDLIKLCAIEAGGFALVAPNLEDARNRVVPPKFYLDKTEDTAATNTEISKLRNKAGSILEDLYGKNINKLFYILKVVDSDSAQYKKSTPNDVLYQNADRYISGESVDKNKKRTAQHFIDVSSLDMEVLKIRAIVKDAMYYKFLATKSDGFIYVMSSGTMLGRTLADVVEYLRNPMNEDVLKDLMERVEQFWNQ